MQSRLTDQFDDVTTLLSGGTPIECGNGVIDGNDQCEGLDLGGGDCASLGFSGGTLTCEPGCFYDLSACIPFPPVDGVFPATGQVTCSDSAGAVVACAGTGQDSDLQAGGAQSYTDNGDGTITDENTGLMWEKMSDDGSIHDFDNIYTWNDAFAVKIAGLNDPNDPFAGYTDWRLPNSKELPSIVDYEVFSPAAPPEFDINCGFGCTVLGCSCMAASRTWSSTSNHVNKTLAWFVLFSNGAMRADSKAFSYRVRAVRGP